MKKGLLHFTGGVVAGSNLSKKARKNLLWTGDLTNESSNQTGFSEHVRKVYNIKKSVENKDSLSSPGSGFLGHGKQTRSSSNNIKQEPRYQQRTSTRNIIIDALVLYYCTHNTNNESYTSPVMYRSWLLLL